jgi:hypothetical protein
MLKDRRVLMEKEIQEMKHDCGQLYLKIAKNQHIPGDQTRYDTMRSLLTDMMVDLAVVDQMIADGHE